MQKPQAPKPSAVKTAAKPSAGLPPRSAIPQPGAAIASPYPFKRPNIQSLGSLLALAITLFWFAFIAWNVIKAGGFAAWLAGTTAAAAVTVSSLMLAPAALFWMIVAYLQRAADVREATQPLRQMLLAAAGVNADLRFSRLHAALREQIGLIKSAGEEGTKTARATLANLAEQNESLAEVTGGAAQRLTQAGDTLRSHIGSFESLLRAADQGLSGLDRNVTGLAQTLGQRIEAMESLLDRLGERIERQAGTLMQDASKRLDRAAELQEEMEKRSQLFAETLRALGDELLTRTREIDQLMGRFGDSAETVRRDTDKTTTSLQTQVRALDQTAAALRERASDAATLVGQSVATLDERARALAGLTENCRSILQREGQAMAEIAEQVGERYRHTTDGLGRLLSDWSAEQRQMSERLDSIDGRMTERTQSLALQTAALTDAAQSLLATAQNTDSRLAAAAALSADRYTTVSRVAEMQTEKMLASVGGLLDRQETVIACLDAQSGSLRMLAARAGETLEDVSRTLDARTQSLAAIEKAFVADAEALKSATADIVGNLDTLTGRLEHARLTTSEAVAATVGKLADAATETLRQTDALGGASEAALRSLATASDVLAQRAVALGQTGQLAETALAGAEASLNAKAGQIRQEIESTSEGALGHIDVTIRRLRSLPPVLVEEAGRAGATLTALADQIANHTRDFTTALGAEISRLEAAGQSEAAIFDVARQDLDARTQKLLAASSQATEATRALAGQSEAAATGLTLATAALTDAALRIETEETRLERQLTATAGAGDQLAIRAVEWRSKLSLDAEKMLVAVEASVARLDTLREAFAGSAQAILKDVGGNRDALAAALAGAGAELDGGSRQLKETLQSASTYLASFGTRLTQQVGALAATDQELRALCDRMTDGIAAVTGAAEQAAGIVGDLVKGADSAAAGLADRAIERLANAVTLIERDVVTLGETAEQTGQKLHKATTVLRDDVSTLAANSDYSVGQVLALVQKCADQGAAVRTALLEQTGEIHDGLGKMLLGIETATDTIREKSDAAYALLDKVSARYAEVAVSTHNALEDGGARLGAGASGLREALEALRQMIGDNMAAFTSAESSLGEAATRIGRQAETVQAQMRAAIERIEAGESKTAVTADSITGRMAEMTGMLDRQIDGLTHGAGAAISALEGAARSFSSEAEEIRKQAYGIEAQVRSVTTLSQQMREQAGAVMRSMNEEATRLSENMLRTIAEAEQVDSRLQQMAASSGGAVEDSARQLRQASAVLAERLASDKVALGEFANHFESSLASLGDSLTAQLARFADSADVAASRAMDADRRIAETRTGALADLSSIGEKIKIVWTEAEEAAKRVEMAGEIAEQRMGLLKTRAEQAAVVLDHAGETAIQHVRVLAGETDHAEHRSKALVEAGAELYEKTRSIREAMQAEHDGMLASLARALLQLENAESAIGRHKETADARLEDAVRLVARAGETAATLMENQIGNLRLTANEAVQQFEMAGAGLDQQRQRILDAAGRFAAEMGRLIETGGHVEGDAGAILKRIETLRDAIVGGIDGIRDRVQTSTAEMARELAHLAEGADQTVSSVHAAASAVSRETGMLASGTDQALTQVMQATQTFGAGVAALENNLTATGMKVMNLVEDLRAEANATGMRMQGLLDALDRQSAEVTERVTGNAGHLARRAEETGALLGGLGAQLVRQIEGLDQGLEMVSGSARAALKAVETINGAFGEKANELESRVSRLQGNLARQSATLADALSDIIRQVESAGEDIVEETQKAV